MTHWLTLKILDRFLPPRQALAALGFALTLSLAAGCGGSAIVDQPYLAYPALRARGASGIAVVSPAVARRIRTTPTRPVWVSEKAHESSEALPNITSAREVRREGERRVWISRSDKNGVCALIFAPELAPDPRHDHSVSASCGTKHELTRGVVVLWRVRRRGSIRSLVFGVVPRGVAAMALTLTSGRQRAVPVAHNSYSAEVTAGVVSVTPLHGIPAAVAP
jgi:hypothetical protein